jgi:hypothetical protein
MDYLKILLLYTLCIAKGKLPVAPNLQRKEGCAATVQGAEQATRVRGAMQRMRWVVHAKRDPSRPHHPYWTAKGL